MASTKMSSRPSGYLGPFPEPFFLREGGGGCSENVDLYRAYSQGLKARGVLIWRKVDRLEQNITMA